MTRFRCTALFTCILLHPALAQLDNGQTRISAVEENDGVVALELSSGEGAALARIALGPKGLWTARSWEQGDNVWVLSEFDTSGTGGTPALGEGSTISVSLSEGSPWPRVAFDLDLQAFNVQAWEDALGMRVPFHYLICTVPGAELLYQGGALIPSPEVDPFPLSRDRMSGAWDGTWSYAPAMAAYAVPAVGLWAPRAARFVAYDFHHARLTDRSSKYIASAYDGEASSFALVHPHARLWTELTYPRTPARVRSHFDLVYSTDLTPQRDANQFILQRLFTDMSDLLPGVPAMNDLGWIPEFDAWTVSPGLPRTGAGTQLMSPSQPMGLEGVFVEPGATMLGNDFIGDGLEAAYERGDQSAIDLTKRQLEALMQRAERFEMDGEQCIAWSHPLDGRFRDQYGGDAVRGYHHPSTFHIGTAYLLLYKHEGDPRYLEYVDGVYNWCRHYMWTRNGVCDLPWSMFSRAGTAAGENFLMNYHHLFRNDPIRGERAAEALDLALMSLYKVLWVYVSDPDETDDMDPAFLTQAVNDRWWIGQVTWNECGWFVRSIVPIYAETGDTGLRHLLRGILERYFVGRNRDGYTYAEDVEIFGEQNEKGWRSAEFDPCHAGSVRRWARPPGEAAARVVMGAKAAIAFCKGTTAVDVADYAYASEGGFRFRVASALGRPFDLVATAPFRDLRGLEVWVNGEAVEAARVEFNPATSGEDVYIRGVADGDVITIGLAPEGGPLPEVRLAERVLPDPTWRDEGAFGVLNLGHLANQALDTRWAADAPWRGLVPGRHDIDGVPYEVIDPALTEGRNAAADTALEVDLDAEYLRVLVGRPSPGAPWPTISVSPAGEGNGIKALSTFTPVSITNGWVTPGWEVGVGGVLLTGHVSTIRVEGGSLLGVTAVTDAGVARSMVARELERDLARVDELADQTASLQALAAAAERAQEALEGKSVRIALLPPHQDLVKYSHIEQAKMERRITTLAQQLGLTTRLLSPAQLVDERAFSADAYPIAIYACGEEYIRTVNTEGDGEEALKRYLDEGGILLTLSPKGTYPLVYPMDRIDGHWVTQPLGILADGTGRSVFATQLGLNVTFSGDCGWELPPPGAALEFRPTGDPALPSLRQTQPYPDSGDLRYRSIMPAALPEGARLRPLVELRDGEGRYHGAAAGTVELRSGGTVGYVWGRLFDAPRGDALMADLLAYAAGVVRPERLTEPAGAGPVAQAEPGLVEGSIVVDGSLENRAMAWSVQPFDVFCDYGARSGDYCAELTLHEDGGTCVLTTRPSQARAMDIEPNARYRLTFWAKTVSGRGLVRCNFFGGQGYDFEQVPVDLISDGEWHRYEVSLMTGDFAKVDMTTRAFAPPTAVTPALRIWTLQHRQKTFIDDISLTRELRPDGGPA